MFDFHLFVVFWPAAAQNVVYEREKLSNGKEEEDNAHVFIPFMGAATHWKDSIGGASSEADGVDEGTKDKESENEAEEDGSIVVPEFNGDENISGDVGEIDGGLEEVEEITEDSDASHFLFLIFVQIRFSFKRKQHVFDFERKCQKEI